MKTKYILIVKDEPGPYHLMPPRCGIHSGESLGAIVRLLVSAGEALLHDQRGQLVRAYAEAMANRAGLDPENLNCRALEILQSVAAGKLSMPYGLELLGPSFGKPSRRLFQTYIGELFAPDEEVWRNEHEARQKRIREYAAAYASLEGGPIGRYLSRACRIFPPKKIVIQATGAQGDQAR